MSETTKLLPCPFCSSRCVSMLGNDNCVEDRWRQVRCDDCGGRSNEFPSNSEKAAAHWNTRAANHQTGSTADRTTLARDLYEWDDMDGPDFDRLPEPQREAFFDQADFVIERAAIRAMKGDGGAQ